MFACLRWSFWACEQRLWWDIKVQQLSLLRHCNWCDQAILRTPSVPRCFSSRPTLDSGFLFMFHCCMFKRHTSYSTELTGPLTDRQMDNCHWFSAGDHDWLLKNHFRCVHTAKQLYVFFVGFLSRSLLSASHKFRSGAPRICWCRQPCGNTLESSKTCHLFSSTCINVVNW